SLGCISFWLWFLLEPEETVDMHVVHWTREIQCNFGG
ncbi:unnamed protein product, partial [Brassica rapa]